MISPKRSIEAESVEKTIKVIYELVSHGDKPRLKASLTELALRKELASCILGSGVRHEMAIGAVSKLDDERVFGRFWTTASSREFRRKVENILAGRFANSSRGPAYRFPKTRATQLAGARSATLQTPLSELLRSLQPVVELRQLLVRVFPGLGPKQASMFIRNVGISDSVAVLDTHLLAYLKMKGLSSSSPSRMQRLDEYEATERILLRHIRQLRYQAHTFDSAVWITFKALRELHLCAS